MREWVGHLGGTGVKFLLTTAGVGFHSTIGRVGGGGKLAGEGELSLH